MPGGYMGKILWVDLSKREIREETPDESLYRDYVGGYGLASRLIFDGQRARVDPLGPENILGFTTGPLTGSPALSGARYTLVGKSPLTGTWGDANSGGDFGPGLKFAGYDAVFFKGLSETPVYLFVDSGRPELRDASHLWGKDTFEVEDIVRGRLGEDVKVSSIGPSGEKLSLISCPVNNKGRAPGRSGLGAVMGSKKLKAIAVKGAMEVPIANAARAREMRRKHLGELSDPWADTFRDYGTPAATARLAHSGDSPVKNWGGVGTTDFPNAEAIGGDAVIALQRRKYACWRCPLGCGGQMKAGTEYHYAAGAHKPEYETLCSFGTLCLSDNVESIIEANDICNRYGLDTISTGAVIAFAIECYENGVITREDTDDIELRWGNHRAIVAMTKKLAMRDGFGDVLADGVKVAAEKIGGAAEEFAIHVHGQEPGMHDPKFGPHWATTFKMDATPGRHTQGSEGLVPEGISMPQLSRTTYEGRGEAHKIGSSFCHVTNASGMCLFMQICLKAQALPDFLNSVTGWDVSIDDLLKIGERIANMRHAFNLREGLNPLEFQVPGRVLGRPPMEVGPHARVEVDIDTMVRDYLQAMDWDPVTARPLRSKLAELGMRDVADALEIV